MSGCWKLGVRIWSLTRVRDSDKRVCASVRFPCHEVTILRRLPEAVLLFPPVHIDTEKATRGLDFSLNLFYNLNCAMPIIKGDNDEVWRSGQTFEEVEGSV